MQKITVVTEIQNGVEVEIEKEINYEIIDGTPVIKIGFKDEEQLFEQWNMIEFRVNTKQKKIKSFWERSYVLQNGSTVPVKSVDQEKGDLITDLDYYNFETISEGISYLGYVALVPQVPKLILNAGAKKLKYGEVFTNEEIF
jgi:hypothetical protein